ncbi:hypothetical protein M413DRAFT_446632 [Hebeloma cylindrosporum]|uniref:Uncharacterized protein n=1 Tax=Hebeloma cylindrosporum TaxID=76867 RepID=A0A0C3BST1_HEBCY|nr:hypothetical protein M413DRAFT_446632 [Hebeloma cylindrosporum h7]
MHRSYLQVGQEKKPRCYFTAAARNTYGTRRRNYETKRVFVVRVDDGECSRHKR